MVLGYYTAIGCMAGVEIREKFLTGHEFTNLLKSVPLWGVTMVDENFNFLVF